MALQYASAGTAPTVIIQAVTWSTGTTAITNASDVECWLGPSSTEQTRPLPPGAVITVPNTSTLYVRAAADSTPLTLELRNSGQAFG